jgi:hypothetical protein
MCFRIGSCCSIDKAIFPSSLLYLVLVSGAGWGGEEDISVPPGSLIVPNLLMKSDPIFNYRLNRIVTLVVGFGILLL